MAWLSRNDFVPTDRVRSDMFNSLANDDRNWGGDVNGGGHTLSNIILAGSGGFEFRVSPLEITPGSDGQTVVQFDQTVSVNQLARWTVGKTAAAETGGNAGSDFHIKRFNDAGAYLDSPFQIRRSNGQLLMGSQQWLGPVDANNQTVSNIVIAGMMIDPTTTKGDLVVRSATAPARLGVGSDGQLLTADSTQTVGIRWVTNNAVPNTRQVIAGIGMTGGGALTADVTLNANVTSVFGRTGAIVLTPADLTGQGAVLNTRAIIAGPGLTGGGTLAADVTLNANVTSVFGRTGAIVLTAADISGAGGVPATRQVITSTGLTGGGDLTADRTLMVVEDSTTQRIRFSNAGVLVGTRREVNLIAGPNISFTTFADNTANNRIDLTIASTTAMITVYTNSAVLGQATAIDFSAGPNVVIGGSMDGTRANLVITSAGGGAGGMIDPTQAVGDLIVRSPTTTVRFPASLTDGWVLTADAAEPLKMKWAVPKGGIEDPTTLAGDILVRNATVVTNLPVGSTSGWVLTVDQNAAEKIKWAPIPAGVLQTPWTQDINAAGYRLINTGNVGIGTVNAPLRLTVTGSSGEQGQAGTAGIMQITTGSGIDTDDKIQIGIVEGGYGWIQVLKAGTAYRPLILQPSGGNVGIGGTNPTAKLDINGGSLPSAATSTIVVSRLFANTTNGDFLNFQIIRASAGSDWTTAEWRIQRQVDATSMSWLGFPGSDCVIGTGVPAAERMRVSSSGNVGIGLTNPQTRLAVVGGVGGPALGSPGGNLTVHADSGAWGLFFGGLPDGSSWLQGQRNDGNTAAYNILLNPIGGNVGIGTQGPTARFEADVEGSSGATVIHARNPVATWGSTSAFNSYRFFLSSSAAGDGNFKAVHVGAGGVGIGYNSPIYGSNDALYVVGNVGIGTANPAAAVHIRSSPERNIHIGNMDFAYSGSVGINAANDANNANIPLILGGNPIRFHGAAESGNRLLAWSNVVDPGRGNAAIEVRETSLAGAGSSGNWSYAPRISFHWGGTVASQVAMTNTGRICVRTDPGTAFGDFQCASLFADNWNGFTQQSGTGTPPGAYQVVVTEAQGHIFAGWINTVSGDSGTLPISRVYASSDGYIRYYTLANFAAQIKPRVLSGQAPDAELAEGQVSVFPVAANRMQFKWRWGGAVITKYIDFL